MQTLHDISIASDKALNAAIDAHNDKPEWTDKDKAHAKNELYQAIVDGEFWDENFTGFRQNLAEDLMDITFEHERGEIKRADLAGLVRDAFYFNVTAHCNYEVEINPNKYCERFCND